MLALNQSHLAGDKCHLRIDHGPVAGRACLGMASTKNSNIGHHGPSSAHNLRLNRRCPFDAPQHFLLPTCTLRISPA